MDDYSLQKMRKNFNLHFFYSFIYLYGPYAKDTYHEYSDIDLAVFWNKDEIDGFDEDVLLMKLTRIVDLRIEPHSFAKSDFDETNPYIKEILETGERII